MNLQDAIKRARLSLLNNKINFAFIGSILHKFTIESEPSIKTIKYLGSDRKILVNEEWFCKLSSEHAATSLAHIAYHYALQHDIRKGKRVDNLYQQACDQVVNNLLKDSGFQLPYDVERNLKREYKNLTTEVVYNFIEDEWNRQNQKRKKQNNQPDSLGSDITFENLPNSYQINQRKKDVNQANTSQSMATGKSAGNGFEALEQFFKAINKSQVDWITQLQRYFNEITQGDRDFARLERRYLPMELYLPSTQSENTVSKIALAFDVSGSVTEEQIEYFLGETKRIKAQLDPEIIDVMTFNTRVVDVFSFKQHEDISNVRMSIGGGTDFSPIFEHYNKPENKPKFLIVFSDMYCDIYKEKPTYETIWVSIDNPKVEVEFGKVIHINSEDIND